MDSPVRINTGIQLVPVSLNCSGRTDVICMKQYMVHVISSFFFILYLAIKKSKKPEKKGNR